MNWSDYLYLELKCSLLLSVAGLLCLIFRQWSAAQRHLVWSLAMVGTVLIPLIIVALPQWKLPVLPETTAVQWTSRPFAEPPIPEPVTPEKETFISPAPAPTKAQPQTTPTSSFPAGTFLMGLWSIGGGLVMLSMLAGQFAIKRLERRANPAAPVWTDLSVQLRNRMGVAHSVEVLETETSSMPMATGLLRHRILLPGSGREWPAEEQEAVLAHELAHVKRRDCLTHFISTFALALHWFNPLYWYAMRRMRLEREHACDDYVLSAGAEPTAYADHLLSIARTMSCRLPVLGVAISMARKNALEGRLLAILDEARNRKALCRRAGIAALLLLVGIAMPLAAVTSDSRPTAQSASAMPTVQDVECLYGEFTAAAKAENLDGIMEILHFDSTPTRKRARELLSAMIKDDSHALALGSTPRIYKVSVLPTGGWSADCLLSIPSEDEHIPYAVQVVESGGRYKLALFNTAYLDRMEEVRTKTPEQIGREAMEQMRATWRDAKGSRLEKLYQQQIEQQHKMIEAALYAEQHGIKLASPFQREVTEKKLQELTALTPEGLREIMLSDIGSDPRLPAKKEGNDASQIVETVNGFFSAVAEGRDLDAMKMLRYEEERAARLLEGMKQIPGIDGIYAATGRVAENNAIVGTYAFMGLESKTGYWAVNLIKDKGEWIIKDFDLASSEKMLQEEIEGFMERNPNATRMDASKPQVVWPSGKSENDTGTIAGSKAKVDLPVRFITSDYGGEAERFHWRLHLTRPVRLCYHSITLEGETLSGYWGNVLGTEAGPANGAIIDCQVVVSNGNSTLDYCMRNSQSHEGLSGFDGPATSSVKQICLPGHDRIRTYILRDPEELTTLYLPLWRRDYIKDDRVVKTVVYAVRIAKEGEVEHPVAPVAKDLMGNMSYMEEIDCPQPKAHSPVAGGAHLDKVEPDTVPSLRQNEDVTHRAHPSGTDIAKGFLGEWVALKQVMFPGGTLILSLEKNGRALLYGGGLRRRITWELNVDELVLQTANGVRTVDIGKDGLLNWRKDGLATMKFERSGIHEKAIPTLVNTAEAGRQLEARLDAARHITFASDKDSALAVIAVDAGRLRNVKVALAALRQMTFATAKDNAASQCADRFITHGMSAEATLVATTMTFMSSKDQVMERIARGAANQTASEPNPSDAQTVVLQPTVPEIIPTVLPENMENMQKRMKDMQKQMESMMESMGN